MKLSEHRTHRELYDTTLRQLVARYLWVLRKLRKQKISMKSDWVSGIRCGLETMARRVQDERTN